MDNHNPLTHIKEPIILACRMVDVMEEGQPMQMVVDYIDHPHPVVRETAANMATFLCCQSALDLLYERLKVEQHEKVLSEIRDSIQHLEMIRSDFPERFSNT